jgi:thiol-disulfide isomerase/thioredoxin
MLLSLVIFSAAITAQGYNIKVKISKLPGKQIILGHYLSKTMYPDDTITLDQKGFGAFTGKKKLAQGMYLIYLPSTTYFDMVVGDDQDFSLETDTSDFVRTLSFKGSDENQLFQDFQKYFASLRSKADSITKLLKTQTDNTAKENLSAQLKNVNEQRIKRIEQINREHPDLFVSTFLKATLDVTVPDPPRDEKGAIIDSNWQYYFYRSHYFDNFNISDARLLRTPFYEDKIMTFLTKVLPQHPDTLNLYVDKFIEKSRGDSALFRYMLITLFNYFGKSNIMGMDAVQVHIADKYYITESWWSDAKFIADLKERTEKARPLLIGAVAPDAELMLVPADHFKSALADTSLRRYPHVGSKINLSQVKSKYLVLIFWEADCGHCKIAVPELYKVYERTLKNLGVEVLAISTLFGEDGKMKWVDFVNEHKLYDWMNAWNPYSYDFKLRYDVLTTPQIYILDENKKILAKRISPDQVEEIIKSLTKG